MARGSGTAPEHWRDTHFRVEGPVVAQIQAAFGDNRMHAFGELLHGQNYFPDLDPAGVHMAQVYTGAPGRGAKNMQLMFLFALAAAARSIHISAAYFVPDDAAINALMASIRRGVAVRIIVPGCHIDRPVVRYASRSLWGSLLRAGAEIYEYQPAMFHAKVMVIDELWVSVGSTNFDTRSFSINDEVNMNIYDAAFAQRQIAIFEEDTKESRRITLEEWENRPRQEKILEKLAALRSSQM